MPRVKRRSINSKHKKVLKQASGYVGRPSKCYKAALQAVEKSHIYAYRDRKKRKSSFRNLWVQRINAFLRKKNLKYSSFVNILKNKKIEINRKMLSQTAFLNPEVFCLFIDQVCNEQISKE